MAEIMRDFDGGVGLYTAFTEKTHLLVREVLSNRNLVIHSVSARTKARASFERKISKVEGRYERVGDVTDIVGIRVITYFSSDVDRVANALAQEFTIDDTHSVDKRHILETDRFGYLSLHSVVSLSATRLALYEYKQYQGLRAEIQIRSILQHAWAEIEHDLGYKTAAEIPKPVRRQFSRLAGLLEIADNEFVSIRNALRNYENEVPSRIRMEPESVSLDRASLTAFVNSSAIVREIDEQIATFAGGKILPMLGTAIERHLSGLRILGIESVGQLETSLRSRREDLLQLAAEWLRGREADVNELVSLVYLAYSLLSERGSVELAESFLRASGVEEHRVTSDADIIATYKRSR